MKRSREVLTILLSKKSEKMLWLSSNRNKRISYLVRKPIGKKWECDCIAGMTNKLCHHIKKAMSNSDKCFNCGISWWAANGLEKHHIYRRSTNPALKEDLDNIVLLCRKCHYRATTNRDFEVNLKNIINERE